MAPAPPRRSSTATPLRSIPRGSLDEAHARKVILEEGIHGVWNDPDVAKARAAFERDVTDADREAVRAERQPLGLNVSPEVLHEEATVAKILAEPEQSSRLRAFWDAIVAAVRRVFGIKTSREQIIAAATEFLKGRRRGMEPATREATGTDDEATYVGRMEGTPAGEGYEATPAIELYNLKRPIVDEAGRVLHPENSTVSRETLQKYGVRHPAPPSEVRQAAGVPTPEERDEEFRVGENDVREAGFKTRADFDDAYAAKALKQYDEKPDEFLTRTYCQGLTQGLMSLA